MKLPLALLFILSLLSCKKQNINNSLPPKKVKENQYIYHYTSQKKLDTIPFYNFKLRKKDSVSKKNDFHNSKLVREDWDKLLGKYKDIDLFDINKRGLDYLILYNSETKKEAQKLVIDKFAKELKPWWFINYHHYLKDNTSDYYLKKLEEIKTKLDKKPREKYYPYNHHYVSGFFHYTLPEYARIGGKKVIPNILKWHKEILQKDKYDNSKYNKSFATAVRVLIKYHDIDKKTQLMLTKHLKKHSYHSQKKDSAKHYIYYKDLEKIKIFLKNNGHKKELSIEDEKAIAMSFYKNNYSIDIKDILQRYNLLFFYDKDNYGIGRFNINGPGNYNETMNLFLKVCEEEIPDMDIQTSLKTNSIFGIPNYALLLGNDKEAFVVKTTDKKEGDFDHTVIKDLFNNVLNIKGISKKFEYAKNTSHRRYAAVFYNKPLIDSLLIHFKQKIIWDYENY